MKPAVIAIIFARGGSKGVPGKNIRRLGDIPLIGRAITCARSCATIDRVVVSTDDTEIAEVARHYGAELPFVRPAHLATDEADEWLAWQHAVAGIDQGGLQDTDILVSLPATAPFRRAEDVERCITVVQGSGVDGAMCVTTAARNPFFFAVTLDADQRVSRLLADQRSTVRRQDAPAVYDIASVAFAAKVGFVRRAESWFDGRLKAVVVSAESALDIDTEMDFAFAEFMMQQTGCERDADNQD